MLVNAMAAELLEMPLHEPNDTGLQPLPGAWKQESGDVHAGILI